MVRNKIISKRIITFCFETEILARAQIASFVRARDRSSFARIGCAQAAFGQADVPSEPRSDLKYASRCCLLRDSDAFCESNEDGSEILWRRQRSGKPQAGDIVAARKVQSFGIDGREPPTGALCSREDGIVLDRVGMIGIHMRDRAVLNVGQTFETAERRRKIAAVQRVGFSKAGVERGPRRCKPPEREIWKVDIQHGFGMAPEVALFEMVSFRSVTKNFCTAD